MAANPTPPSKGKSDSLAVTKPVDAVIPPAEQAAMVQPVPAHQAVASVPPAADTKPPLAPTSAREKLAGMNGVHDGVTVYAPTPQPVADPASHGLANRDRDEFQANMLAKISVLEKEKENLRKRLMALDPGNIGPVYQCAAQDKQVALLEGKVKFLLEENDALRKKNQDLMTIPPLPSSDLSKLPEEHTPTKSKPDIHDESRVKAP